ncbi:MAG TPA: serine--tRNA ligase [Candidatus Saccharimonadales bacterium]|nr:serine--tRNA ligase [Candidatus Saccharimonadales bacterium]
MLDIQFIRDNRDLVETKSRQKGYEVNIHRLLQLDEERRSLITAVETLRRRRNEHSDKIKHHGKPEAGIIEQGRAIKAELSQSEERLKGVEHDFEQLIKAVPNMPLDDVPLGMSEDENKVAKRVGEPLNYDFVPRHHWQIAEPRNLIDKERAAKISGSRFAYIKGDLVRLQFAIIQFVLQTLGDEVVLERLIQDNNLNLHPRAFMPILPPAMLRTEPYVASARLDAENLTYKIVQDDLWLNASAEHTLCTMYWEEILPEEMLPIRYIGYSTSFRREAGTYGKDTEGILRMHQFDKLEMEVFSTPETGLDEHLLLVAIQEYLVQQLNLPYQVLQKCTADIGKPNARGVDIECWFPAQGKYRETHTADFMTDYQARDLRIRVRRKKGTVELVHTNDATAFALGRIMAAIMENNQTQDERIIVPEVLRPFMCGQAEI